MREPQPANATAATRGTISNRTVTGHADVLIREQSPMDFECGGICLLLQTKATNLWKWEIEKISLPSIPACFGLLPLDDESCFFTLDWASSPKSQDDSVLTVIGRLLFSPVWVSTRPNRFLSNPDCIALIGLWIGVAKQNYLKNFVFNRSHKEGQMKYRPT